MQEDLEKQKELEVELQNQIRRLNDSLSSLEGQLAQKNHEISIKD